MMLCINYLLTCLLPSTPALKFQKCKPSGVSNNDTSMEQPGTSSLVGADD